MHVVQNGIGTSYWGMTKKHETSYRFLKAVFRKYGHSGQFLCHRSDVSIILSCQYAAVLIIIIPFNLHVYILLSTSNLDIFYF